MSAASLSRAKHEPTDRIDPSGPADALLDASAVAAGRHPVRAVPSRDNLRRPRGVAVNYRGGLAAEVGCEPPEFGLDRESRDRRRADRLDREPGMDLAEVVVTGARDVVTRNSD